jgi:hypothetical protein
LAVTKFKRLRKVSQEKAASARGSLPWDESSMRMVSDSYREITGRKMPDGMTADEAYAELRVFQAKWLKEDSDDEDDEDDEAAAGGSHSRRGVSCGRGGAARCTRASPSTPPRPASRLPGGCLGRRRRHCPFAPFGQGPREDPIGLAGGSG